MSTIKPLGNRVLVKRVEVLETTSGGIMIPTLFQEKSTEAVVVAVGPGTYLEDGTVQPLEVKVGDKVMLNKYSGNELKIEGVEHMLIKEDEILAVIE